MAPEYRPPWLARIQQWLGGLPPNRRERRILAFIIVATVLLLTRQAVVLPIKIGWSASRVLVEKQDERDRLRRTATEYHEAARYFRTDEGKKYARKLMRNYLEDGERLVILEPEAPKERRSAVHRLGEAVAQRKPAVASSARFTLRVLKRWAIDPPSDEKQYDEPPRPKYLEAEDAEASSETAD